jgi:hypothetical protein
LMSVYTTTFCGATCPSGTRLQNVDEKAQPTALGVIYFYPSPCSSTMTTSPSSTSTLMSVFTS